MKRVKTGGRTKGKINNNTAIVRVFISYILEDNCEKFKTEFNKLQGKDYVKLFLQFYKYIDKNPEYERVIDLLINSINTKQNECTSK